MIEITLDDAKVIKKIEIDALYEVNCQTPVVLRTSSGETAVFQADYASQQILQTTISCLPGETPTDFWWLSIDNVRIPMSYQDLQSLAGIMLMQGWSAFQHKQECKEKLRSATTILETENIGK